MEDQFRRRGLLKSFGFVAVGAPLNPSIATGHDLGHAETSAGRAQIASEVALAELDLLNGFHADGKMPDDANFAALETAVRNRLLDLQGRTFLVSMIPSGNHYTNGFFKISSNRFDSDESDSIIASLTDTGGIEEPYAGGARKTPTLSGRSNKKMNGLLWSQNSRAGRLPRNGTIASIYSWITGLVGLILAGRQSYATQPQSIIAGCEECFIDTGSRNAVISSVLSAGEGVSTGTVGSRSSRSSGWEAAVLGSNACVAGAGSGARFRIHVNASGAIESVTILSGGSGYIDPIVDITDRVGTGGGATATVKVINGVVVSVSLTSGGSGYSQDVNAVNLHLLARRSMVVAASNSSTARGNQSFIGGASNSDTVGNQSSVLASNGATASGINSAVIASGVTRGATGANDSKASANNSLVAASSASSANGPSSVALAAVGSAVNASRSMVSGRFVINEVDDSWAAGTSESGPASTANRKIHIHYSGGNIEIAGVLSQNKLFTDIAKMFENAKPGEQIPIGALVSLDGRRVRLATPEDTFFSVHTRNYVQLLGDTAFTWAGRYLYDEHGVILTKDVPDPGWQEMIEDPSWPPFVLNPKHPVFEDLVDEYGNTAMDEVGDPIRYVISQQMMPNPLPAPLIPNPIAQPTIRIQLENPLYDPKKKQMPRSERWTEWTPVLLQGEAFLHVKADVTPGDFIKPIEIGVGGKSTQPTAFLCMEITTPFDPKKGYAIALALRV